MHGEDALDVERDGSFTKEAKTVFDMLERKYGVAPYLLKHNSRYNIEERRNLTSPQLYLFPVGDSSVYVSFNSSALICMNDLEAQKAVADLAQSKTNNMVAGYNVFAASDFLGFEFGITSPGWMKTYLNSTSAVNLDDGTINISFRHGLHDEGGLPVKCREIKSLTVGVTRTSHRIARITAEFDPLENPEEEFDSLCAMCKRKMGVKPQLEKNSEGMRVATFVKRDGIMAVLEEKGYSTRFKAENSEMLSLANKEQEAWRIKTEAAKEATLSGVDAL